MKNRTIKIKEDTHTELKIYAAKNKTTFDKVISNLLNEKNER